MSIGLGHHFITFIVSPDFQDNAKLDFFFPYLSHLCSISTHSHPVPSVIEIKDRVSLQPTKYEKISANHISDKGLESGISKELQLNNKKKQRPD